MKPDRSLKLTRSVYLSLSTEELVSKMADSLTGEISLIFSIGTPFKVGRELHVASIWRETKISLISHLRSIVLSMMCIQSTSALSTMRRCILYCILLRCHWVSSTPWYVPNQLSEKSAFFAEHNSYFNVKVVTS